MEIIKKAVNLIELCWLIIILAVFGSFVIAVCLCLTMLIAGLLDNTARVILYVLSVNPMTINNITSNSYYNYITLSISLITSIIIIVLLWKSKLSEINK